MSFLTVRAAKKNEEPFGGIQLVVTGDFFQLPPVQKDRKRGAQQDFCFNAPVWDALFPEGTEVERAERSVHSQGD